MTISVYEHGKTPALEVGMLRADPGKPGVPLVSEEWVRGERVQAVTAYVHDPRWQNPGWETRAATAEEIAASQSAPLPQPAAVTTAAPVVTTVTPPAVAAKTDWATILARAEQSGEMTDELRAQALRLVANPNATVKPAPNSAAPNSATPIDTNAIYANRAKRANMDDVIAKLDQRM